VSLGMLLATGVFALMTGVISPGDAFLERGWRVPFILSFVLVLLGHFIRRSVDETPIYQDIAERKQQTKAPVAVLFKKHWALIVAAAVLSQAPMPRATSPPVASSPRTPPTPMVLSLSTAPPQCCASAPQQACGS